MYVLWLLAGSQVYIPQNSLSRRKWSKDEFLTVAWCVINWWATARAAILEHVMYFISIKHKNKMGDLMDITEKGGHQGKSKYNFVDDFIICPRQWMWWKYLQYEIKKNLTQWKTGFFQLRRQGAESADGASRPHFERVGLDCTPPCSCRYFWQPPLCSWSESTKSPQVPHTECCQKTRLANAVERLRGKFFRHEIKIWQYWWWSGKEHPMFWPYYSCELVEHVLAVSLVNYALVDAFMHRSGEAGSFRC